MITRNFPPLIGGMEKLNFNIYRALRRKYIAFLAGPVGSAKYHEQDEYVEFSFAPLSIYIFSSAVKSISFSNRLKPDLVFCGSGTAIVAGYFAAKLCSARLVCYLHGLDIVAKSFIYQYFFIPLIRRADLIIVNSRNTNELAISAGMSAEKISILEPGVELPSSLNRQELSCAFRARYELVDKKYILIAGRITARKGIVEFIENSFRQLLLTRPDLVLVIVGEEARHAAKSSNGLTEEIISTVERLGIKGNVIMTGMVSEEIFSGALFSAELLVFPVLDMVNDVEGFGMVAVEAAAHGLPTVAFSAGGVPDAVAHGKSGWLVEPNNYKDMSVAILNYLDRTDDTAVSPYTCKAFAEDFEWRRFEEKLYFILENK